MKTFLTSFSLFFITLFSLTAKPYIETYAERPENCNESLMIFLHGAASTTGLHSLGTAWFEHWLDKGYAVAAISLPGYGTSEGTKDFCGPATIEALSGALDSIKEELQIENIGLIGFGQGGFASVLLSAKRDDITCIVCANSGYDLLRHRRPDDELMPLLERKYGLDRDDIDALTVRSPMYQTETMDTPLYLIQRTPCRWIMEEEVLDFVHLMNTASKECHTSFRERTETRSYDKITDQEVLLEAEEWVDLKMRPGGKQWQ